MTLQLTGSMVLFYKVFVQYTHFKLFHCHITTLNYSVNLKESSVSKCICIITHMTQMCIRKIDTLYTHAILNTWFMDEKEWMWSLIFSDWCNLLYWQQLQPSAFCQCRSVLCCSVFWSFSFHKTLCISQKNSINHRIWGFRSQKPLTWNFPSS